MEKVFCLTRELNPGQLRESLISLPLNHKWNIIIASKMINMMNFSNFGFVVKLWRLETNLLSTAINTKPHFFSLLLPKFCWGIGVMPAGSRWKSSILCSKHHVIFEPICLFHDLFVNKLLFFSGTPFLYVRLHILIMKKAKMKNT